MVWSKRLSPSGGVGVEQAALAAGGHRHADGVADALAERAGRRLDAGGVVDLGVARGLRAPGAQRLAGRRAPCRSRRGRAGRRASGSSGPSRARSGRGRPSSGRSGRAAATSGRAGRRSAPCSSPSRGGRCRPSGRRPWPGRGRCRSPGGRGRRSRRAGSGSAGPGCRWARRSRPRPGPRARCSASCAGCSLEIGPASCGCGVRPGPPLDRERTVVVDVGPTRCARSINVINPSHPRSMPRRSPGAARATVAAFPSPVRKRPPCCSGARRCPAARALPRTRAPGDGAVRAPRRSRPPPARRAPCRVRRLRRAHQAADHRAAAGHDGAGDDAGRRAAGRRCRCCSSTLVGGTLAAGAANVFNCYFDRDIDRLMHRTQKRPLPMGDDHARGRRWSSAPCSRSSSIALLAATTTLLAAALAAGAIFYYAVLYTMVFKRHTRRSTEFGGVPGRGAGADRLGRGDRVAGLAGRRRLRRRLLLADAALLGAGHAVQGRLRAGRRPDAAGGDHARCRSAGRPSPGPG